MKKYIYDILIAAIALLSITSCNETLLEQGGTGYLGISLQRDDEVFLKSVEAPSEDMAFAVSVYRGDELVASRDDHRTVTSDNPIELAADMYRVVATSGDPLVEAAFDAPLYTGETNVTVLPERMNEVKIVATLSNVMVTVSFDSSISDNFTSYSVTAGNSSGTGLTFSNDNGNLDRTGYVRADGTLTWTLVLVDAQGEEYTMTDTYSDVKAQQHYALRFAVAENGDDTGYGAFRLVVDDSMNEKEYDIVLDFDDSSVPQIGAEGSIELGDNNYFAVGDSDSKVLTFTAENGIRSLVMTAPGETLTRSSVWYELVDAGQDVIDELAAKGIKASSVPYGALEASIDITGFVSSLPIGDYCMTFALYDIKNHMTKADLSFTITSDVDVDIVSAVPWAKFAIVEGKWFSRDMPEGMTFSYRKASGNSWTDVPAGSLEFNVEQKTFSAVIESLEPETMYQVKAVSADDGNTRYIEFMTESAGSIANMGFDDWWQDGKVWYPNLDSSVKVWDSANKAAATFIGSSTTPDDNSVSGKAVRMESKYAVIAFAAGNIYTGVFNKVDGVGADLDWGTPFTSRPLALKGYYNYSPAVIDRTKSPYDSYKGQMDKCQIQILLADWDKPFNVNTTSGRFVDFENDEHIIAYAKYESGEATDGYREFTLPLVYRSHRTPKYIVITCCASYLGDYFTGGVGSTLYVDEFSFEYDLANLSPEQAAQVNYR